MGAFINTPPHFHGVTHGHIWLVLTFHRLTPRATYWRSPWRAWRGVWRAPCRPLTYLWPCVRVGGVLINAPILDGGFSTSWSGQDYVQKGSQNGGRLHHSACFILRYTKNAAQLKSLARGSFFYAHCERSKSRFPFTGKFFGPSTVARGNLLPFWQKSIIFIIYATTLHPTIGAKF